MIQKSCAISAHIDKKAMSKPDASSIEKLLAELCIPELTEGDLHKIGKIGSMQLKTWTAFLAFAEKIGPAVTFPDDLFSEALSGHEDQLFNGLNRIVAAPSSTSPAEAAKLPQLITQDRRRQIKGGLIALSVQQITRTQGTTVEGVRIHHNPPAV